MTRFLFLLLLLPLTAFSQVSPAFFDGKWHPVPSRENATFYRLTEYSDSTLNAGIEKNYYISGKIHSINRYSSFYPLTREGLQEAWFEDGKPKSQALYHGNKLDSTFTEWYPNGQARFRINYINGAMDGEVNTWYENGKNRRQDVYKDGKLVSGNCFNEDGGSRFYESFEKEPDLTKLNRHISSKLKYPKASKKAKTEGDVLIYFVLDTEGRVTQTRILRGVNEEINNEALRVMMTAPNMNPGLVDGLPYPYAFIMPVRFKLK